jgi:hypothetical protein
VVVGTVGVMRLGRDESHRLWSRPLIARVLLATNAHPVWVYVGAVSAVSVIVQVMVGDRLCW